MISKSVEMNLQDYKKGPDADPISINIPSQKLNTNLEQKKMSTATINKSDHEASSEDSFSTLTGNSVIYLNNDSIIDIKTDNHSSSTVTGNTDKISEEEKITEGGEVKVSIDQIKNEDQSKVTYNDNQRTKQINKKRFIGEKIRSNSFKYNKTKRLKRRSMEKALRSVSDQDIKSTSSQTLIKKVLARENLHEQTEHSDSSILIVNNKSYESSKISNSPNESSSNSPEGQNSVILLAERSDFPFKSDVINVALAQINNKLNTNSGTLTLGTRLSAGSSKENYWKAKESFLTSDVTLTNNQNGDASFFTIPSDDRYEFAKTSSEFRSLQSNDTTVKANSNDIFNEVIVDDNVEYKMKEKLLNVRPSLLDTVINLGFFHDNSKPSSPKNTHKDKLKTNVLTKTVEDPVNIGMNNTIKLPNEEAISGLIDNAKEKEVRGDLKNKYPKTLQELWDMLTYVIDDAIKKTESALTDKILNEIKNSKDIPTEVIVEPKQAESSTNMTGLQCDLVPNSLLDQIMFNISMDGTKTETLTIPSISIKSLKLKEALVKDHFRGPVVKIPDIGQGDLVEVATTTDTEFEETHKFRHLVRFLRATAVFVRENAVVIVSVPSFFLIMLLLYGFYMLYHRNLVL